MGSGVHHAVCGGGVRVTGQVKPVPMHPETTADPDVLRWMVPAGVLPFVGLVAAAPGLLQERLARGQVEIELRPTAMVVRLVPPASWRSEGAAVRSELAAALHDPSGWVLAQGAVGVSGSSSAVLDAELAQAVREAIAGRAGEYVRSHGGEVELVDVVGGEVLLRLSGACGQCAASTFTLQRHFEAELRAMAPGVVRVRQVA